MQLKQQLVQQVKEDIAEQVAGGHGQDVSVTGKNIGCIDLEPANAPQDQEVNRRVQRIISFCPVIDVYRACLRVNRELHAAAKADLKTRTKLDLRSERKEGSNNDVIIVTKKCDMKAVAKSLEKMTGMTDLTIVSLSMPTMQSLKSLFSQWSPVSLRLEKTDCKPEELGLRLHRLVNLWTKRSTQQTLLNLPEHPPIKDGATLFPQGGAQCRSRPGGGRAGARGGGERATATRNAAQTTRCTRRPAEGRPQRPSHGVAGFLAYTGPSSTGP